MRAVAEPWVGVPLDVVAKRCEAIAAHGTISDDRVGRFIAKLHRADEREQERAASLTPDELEAVLRAMLARDGYVVVAA